MGNQPKPYFDADGKPIMEQSAVALVDILGYTDRIRTAHQNGTEQKELEWFHKQLIEVHPEIQDPSRAKWRLKAWSDNVIVGYPHLGTSVGRIEFFQACNNIGHFQLEMAARGLFIRGGIGVGTVHISDNLIFGHILADIHTVEETAKNPRVILLKSAEDYVDAHPEIKTDSQYTNIVRTDDDNIKFINYMYPLHTRRDSLRETMLLDHKRHIEFNLEQYRDNPGIFEKYIWAAEYHNQSCRQSRFYNDPAFMIRI